MVCLHIPKKGGEEGNGNRKKEEGHYPKPTVGPPSALPALPGEKSGFGYKKEEGERGTRLSFLLSSLSLFLLRRNADEKLLSDYCRTAAAAHQPAAAAT